MQVEEYSVAATEEEAWDLGGQATRFDPIVQVIEVVACCIQDLASKSHETPSRHRVIVHDARRQDHFGGPGGQIVRQILIDSHSHILAVLVVVGVALVLLKVVIAVEQANGINFTVGQVGHIVHALHVVWDVEFVIDDLHEVISHTINLENCAVVVAQIPQFVTVQPAIELLIICDVRVDHHLESVEAGRHEGEVNHRACVNLGLQELGDGYLVQVALRVIDPDISADKRLSLLNDQRREKQEGGGREDQITDSQSEHDGCFGVAGPVRDHVLGDDSIEPAISAAARLHTDPEQCSLHVLKYQHADEGQTEDDQHQDQVHQKEEQSGLLLGNAVRHQVVCREADHDENDRHDHLIDGDAHILQLLNPNPNLLLVAARQVERVPQVFAHRGLDGEVV